MPLIQAYRNVRDTIIYVYFRLRYWRVMKRLRKKQPPYNVCFLASYVSGWKYDSLFQLMLKEEAFNPMIVICPVVNRGHEHMLENIEHCNAYFTDKGYHVECAYNEDGTYVDLATYEPDIAFITTPYKGQLAEPYYVNNIKNALTCYVNYGAGIQPYRWMYALELVQRVWRQFIETQDDLRYVRKWCPWAISNRVVTGYPMYEALTFGSSNPKDWKDPDPKFKRIIWAPHHTIEGQTGMLHFSTFLLYCDFMLEVAEKYKDKVQFVFKPHPVLRRALELHPKWGKERTDAYYKRWEEGENTNFVNGEYVDLFNSSDAMMHDCGSFLQEYLYLHKPVMFLSNVIEESVYNDMAIEMFNCHYKAFSKDDIIRFIEDVVLKGNDTMKEQREEVYSKYLLPPNGVTAAENMLNEIKKELHIS